MIQKKIEELTIEVSSPSEEIKEQLLRTIRIPKNLHYLTDQLPKPNYGNESDVQSSYTMGNSPVHHRPKRNTTNNRSSKSSLPKLSQVLRSNHTPQLVEKKRNKNRGGDGLMIQGKSKIIQDARSQDNKNSKNLEREIREQLKRIYKVRGAQSNGHLNRKKSERSILLPPIRL